MPNAPRRNYPITGVRDAEGYPTNHMAKWMEDVDQALKARDFGFSVYASSDQALTSVTYDTITWDTIENDDGDHFDLSNNQVTIPELDWYDLVCNIQLSGYAAGAFVVLRAMNGADVLAQKYLRPVTANAESYELILLKKLDAGDVISIEVRAPSAGGTTKGGQTLTHFSMKRKV